MRLGQKLHALERHREEQVRDLRRTYRAATRRWAPGRMIRHHPTASLTLGALAGFLLAPRRMAAAGRDGDGNHHEPVRPTSAAPRASAWERGLAEALEALQRDIDLHRLVTELLQSLTGAGVEEAETEFADDPPEYGAGNLAAIPANIELGRLWAPEQGERTN